MDRASTSTGHRAPDRLAPVVLFLLGFGLFIFTRRSELVPTIAVMIAVAPIFILRLSRTLPVRTSLVVIPVGFILTMNIALWSLFEFADATTGLAFNVIRSTLLALLYALPYVIDRLLYARLKPSLWTILTFPIAVTAILFLSSLEGPFDGISAKSIFAIGPFAVIQLSALTGLWGFIFLWSLPATLINHAWETRFQLRTTMAVLAAFVLVFSAVYGYGAYRLFTAVTTPDTVRIASVVLLPEDGRPVSMESLNSQRQALPYEATLTRIETLTADAVRRGAQIVAFQEYATTVLEDDIDRLRADYRRIARDNATWLSITYAWYAEVGKGANVHLLIDPEGQILADYAKRYLWGFGPYGENDIFEKGEEVIQTVDTPHGRIALTICRDTDFPAYTRQAGQQDADIMLTPSYDFPTSRAPSPGGLAVEVGLTHVRPTYNGVSYAMDPYGRVLATMNSADGGDGIMMVDVPTQRLSTLYARFGDWFGWLNVLGLLAITFLSAVRARPRTASTR